MMKKPPTRPLRANPDLDQLKRQAKELLAAFRDGDADAVAEVTAHYRGADPETFALHDAQLVLARSYGFDSWPKLKAYVDGVTVTRLADAVRRDDLAEVRAMLDLRPELVTMDMSENNEHRALHFAVFNRAPGMVRLLMQRGADARQGIYPHRDATTALAIATERGYGDIVAIVHEEEARRRAVTPSAEAESTVADTPVETDSSDAEQAVARGDLEWLRARHAEGTLPPQIDPGRGGLLTFAVKHNRPEVLSLLLDFGLDPDERVRLEGLEEVIYSQSLPLWICAARGKLEMAEILLTHGANPNVHRYASGTPVYSAFRQRDWTMLDLLKRHGGVVDSVTLGLFGETELARQMLAADPEGRLLPPGLLEGRNVSEDLLRGAADGGHLEIVRMALEGVDWPREDDRWYGILMQAVWGGHVECLRLILARADVTLYHPRPYFGRTILHDAAALGRELPPERRAACAALLLDTGARLDVRDSVLQSTPLAWACRWGRSELVSLLLERGADPVEAGAEPWATPRAWALKMGHAAVLAMLPE